MNRRPLTSRHTTWAKRLSSFLSHQNISPNQISCLSVAFSFLPFCIFGGCLTPSPIWTVTSKIGQCFCFLIAAMGIQLRLLCNLLDGMVAVEGKKKSVLGELYNELPDRLSDVLTIVPLGYVAGILPYAKEIGWASAIAALLTAYIRSLGYAVSGKHFYTGPMAKPHRMALVSGVCFLSIACILLDLPHLFLLYGSLCILLAGSILTCVLRCLQIKKLAHAQSASIPH